MVLPQPHWLSPIPPGRRAPGLMSHAFPYLGNKKYPARPQVKGHDTCSVALQPLRISRAVAHPLVSSYLSLSLPPPPPSSPLPPSLFLTPPARPLSSPPSCLPPALRTCSRRVSLWRGGTSGTAPRCLRSPSEARCSKCPLPPGVSAPADA